MGDDGITSPEHGTAYWFFTHMRQSFGSVIRRRWKALMTGIFLVFAGMIFGRTIIQPYVLALRIRIALIVAIAVIALAGWLWARRGGWFRKFVAFTILALAVFTAASDWGEEAHRYVALWWRYNTLNIVELSEMWETCDERIHPLVSIHTVARDLVGDDPQVVTRPTFVRDGSTHRWTMALEPKYPWTRMFGSVEEVFNVSATTAAPSFSGLNRIKVSFQTSQGLLFSRNTHTVTIRRFGLARFLNYQPSNVFFMKNDAGEVVQVVSLIRWRGFIFPRPEFGGVHIISQEEDTFVNSITRLFAGTGYGVQPYEIPKYRFLIGQNILSFETSRYAAESFRFQEGLTAPLPWRHIGDIRIPDMPDDMNEQPFTTCFIQPGKGKALYHYFALEPYGDENRGLNTSLLIPADGTPIVYADRHAKKGEKFIGSSAVPGKIRENKKHYDWSQNSPTESRPYVKRIDGTIRGFWFTTVTTKEGEGRKQSGNAPEITLTDMTFNAPPVWVDPLAPHAWIEKLKSELSHAWLQDK